jgi:hypothetical protein
MTLIVFGFSYGSLDSKVDDFPGSSCHNHAHLFEMGPLKTDCGTPCPLDLPQYQRDELCLSQQVAAWGTANLRRLEAIKQIVDPDELFICRSGVGYSSAVVVSAPASAPTVEAEPTGPPVDKCVRRRK